MTTKKFRSYAKINLFLKMVGIRGDYHEIFSRFIRVKSLYDTMSFEENKTGKFFIDSDFSFPQEKNIIFHTYSSLLSYLDSEKRIVVEEFFKNFSIKIDKRIPMMAGLGGGSSNSATFLNMVDEVLNLQLTLNQKRDIVKNLGSDILFFLYNIDSANVFGTGDIVKIFKEEVLDIEVFTPKIECNTGKIYREFRKNFFNISDINELKYLENISSKEIFKTLSIEFANDLFQPAESVCPKLKSFRKDGYLFSGSGSSFFKIGGLNIV